MSTQPQPKPNGHAAAPATSKSAKPNSKADRPSMHLDDFTDMSPSELMKAMGGNGWFNPDSDDQITWQLGDTTEEAVPRAIFRMNAWMRRYTTMTGCRRPYANVKGKELHLEHMSRDLGIEMHNLRTYWRVGGRMGIWRNGSKEEGTKRLYRCAVVTPKADPAPEEDPKGVCTNPLPPIFQRLKPYMQEQLAKLPPEVLQSAALRYVHIEDVSKATHADLVAALREVTDQHEDNLWRELGIEKKRLESKKEKTPEEADAETARQLRISSLLPHVQGYVQTLFGVVQPANPGMHTAPDGRVQTAPSAATLLPSEPSDSLDLRAVGNSSSPVLRHSQTQFHDGKEREQLPAPKRPVPVESKSETEAIDSFLSGYALLQLNHPEKFDGETVDPEDKGDRMATLKIVRTLGTQAMPAYLSYIEQRVTGKNALGHRLKFGLVVDSWPDTFVRAAAEEEKRQAFADAARLENLRRLEKLEFENAVEAELTRRWEALDEAVRDELKAKAKADLKKSREWPTLSAVLRDGRIATAAMNAYRRALRPAVEEELSRKAEAKHA